MAIEEKEEIYAIIVHLTTGESLDGYVIRGGDIDGDWMVISRKDDMKSPTYIKRDMVVYFELAEI
ncbi:hypothetical protein [Atlantibacter hermannii]|uniref:hypothetical protein n=1 Tax=Atlantibacter hermannii TaxID=565 RepID=UPI002FD96AA9